VLKTTWYDYAFLPRNGCFNSKLLLRTSWHLVEEELMSLYEESILHSWQKKGVGTKHLEKNNDCIVLHQAWALSFKGYLYNYFS